MNDDLTRRLREAAAAIDEATEPVSADDARARLAPSGAADRRPVVWAAAAALILVVAVGAVVLFPDDANTEIGPVDTPSTTIATTTTMSSGPIVVVPDASALAVAGDSPRDGTLYDFNGDVVEEFQLSEGILSLRDRVIQIDRSGAEPLIAVVPDYDTANYPLLNKGDDGCWTFLESPTGIIGSCDDTFRTLDVTAGGERRVLLEPPVGSPPFEPENSRRFSWNTFVYFDLSPDGRWLLAEWFGMSAAEDASLPIDSTDPASPSCERRTVSYAVNVETGDTRIIGAQGDDWRDARGFRVLGWTEDGRALVQVQDRTCPLLGLDVTEVIADASVYAYSTEDDEIELILEHRNTEDPTIVAVREIGERPTAVPAPSLDIEALPVEGVAISGPDGQTQLYDLAGELVSTTATPVGTNNGRHWLASVRSGLALTVHPEVLEIPDGCSVAVAMGASRYAVCEDGRAIHAVDHNGEHQTVYGVPPADPEWTEGVLGRWSRLIPAPDGSALLAQWNGECELPHAFVIDLGGGANAILDGPDDQWWTAPASVPLGWQGDEMIVELLDNSCGFGVPTPGVHRIEPDGETAHLVVPFDDEPGLSASWFRKDCNCGNAIETAVVAAIESLGLPTCCGEPSHGGPGATTGVVVDGVEIPLRAGPHHSMLQALGRGVEAPIITAAADRPLIAIATTARSVWTQNTSVTFSCREHTFAFGVEGLTMSAVIELAETMTTRVGCTLVEPQLVAMSRALVDTFGDDRSTVVVGGTTVGLIAEVTLAGAESSWSREIFETVDLLVDGTAATYGTFATGIPIVTVPCGDYTLGIAWATEPAGDVGAELSDATREVLDRLGCGAGATVIG